jgi:hypothetical protein
MDPELSCIFRIPLGDYPYFPHHISQFLP